MSKFKYFELTEFLRSNKARELRIDNSPTFEIVEHIEELVGNILDPLRAAYGMPIKVTSGYRCAELNKVVGGVVGSVHQLGRACDLQVGGSFDKFVVFVVDWFKKTGTKFDQILVESANGVKWLHIGQYNNVGQQRGIIKTIVK